MVGTWHYSALLLVPYIAGDFTYDSIGYDSPTAYSIMTVTGPSLSGSVIRKPHVELDNGSPAASRQESLVRRIKWIGGSTWLVWLKDACGIFGDIRTYLTPLQSTS